MESVHLNIQDGAKVKLYMDAVSDGASPIRSLMTQPQR